MASLPATPPDCDRRWVLSVPRDPHLRFDTCDYSLNPALVGRRVEVSVTDSSSARHRTITALEHARARPRRENPTKVEEPGFVLELEDVGPGNGAKLVLPLRKGHYVLVCNIDGHAAQGMKADLDVK